MSEVQHREQIVPCLRIPQVYGKLDQSFIERLPTPDSMALSGRFKALNSGTRKEHRYIHRVTRWERFEECPDVMREMLKFYGFRNISMFYSLEKETQHGLRWHRDDYDVLAFNMVGTTTWISRISGDVKDTTSEVEFELEPYTLIYMPAGWQHRVRVDNERFSVSLVRDPTDPKYDASRYK